MHLRTLAAPPAARLIGTIFGLRSGVRVGGCGGSGLPFGWGFGVGSSTPFGGGFSVGSPTPLGLGFGVGSSVPGIGPFLP